mgnify:CR=1 FL=1
MLESIAFDTNAMWREMIDEMERRSVHPWPNLSSQGIQYLEELRECFLCAAQRIPNPHAPSHTSPVATPVPRKRHRSDAIQPAGSPSRMYFPVFVLVSMFLKN